MLQPEENQHPRLEDQPNLPTAIEPALVRESIIYMEQAMPRFFGGSGNALSHRVAVGSQTGTRCNGGSACG
jgi:hypothetical protein